MITIFNKEVFPENIRFLVDDECDINRQQLKEIFGGDWNSKFHTGHSYLEVDIKQRTWRPCLDFEWLYRNSPPTTTIEEMKNKHEI